MSKQIIKFLDIMKKEDLSVNINMKDEEDAFEISTSGETTYQVEEGFLTIHEKYDIEYEELKDEDGIVVQEAKTEKYSNHFLIAVDCISSIQEA